VATVAIPFGIAASAILVTGWLVGVFYCLDALNGERRDRSILFWKSMPVSDLATIGAKVAIALAVVPAIATAVAFATQVAMLLTGSIVIAARDGGSATLLSTLPFATMTLVMLYGVFVHILWFAPIYAWLLLVSGWARRATFAWAFLPFFAAFAVEKIAFGTHYVGPFIRYRITGAMGHAFAPNAMKEPITDLAMLTPERFFATPGLWLGLVFAAACIAAAVRLRRYREPT
jgi:ABC-2 type transport system permease protein